MKLSIYSYNIGSQGAKALADELGVKLISHKNSKFKGKIDKIVINWGASSLPVEITKCGIIWNEDVSVATNKLEFFRELEGLDVTPRFADTKEKALQLLAEGNTLVARTILNGHSGNGIVLIEPNCPASFVDAPLYTVYEKKKHEFRVHVFGGKVIDVQRKAKKKDFEGEVNYKIRNLQNGFIYAREGFETPSCVETVSLKVIDELKLDFGAVDVIYNESQGRALVLEINTAPGLQGTTVTNYAKAIKEYLNV